MLNFIQNIGRTALTFLSALGRLTLFSVIAVRWTYAALLLATATQTNH